MNFLITYNLSQITISLFHRIAANKQTYFMDIEVIITELSNDVVKVRVK